MSTYGPSHKTGSVLWSLLNKNSVRHPEKSTTDRTPSSPAPPPPAPFSGWCLTTWRCINLKLKFDTQLCTFPWFRDILNLLIPFLDEGIAISQSQYLYQGRNLTTELFPFEDYQTVNKTGNYGAGNRFNFSVIFCSSYSHIYIHWLTSSGTQVDVSQTGTCFSPSPRWMLALQWR